MWGYCTSNSAVVNTAYPIFREMIFWAFAKFRSQSTQVAGAGGVQEELQHELNARLGGDEGFEHLFSV